MADVKLQNFADFNATEIVAEAVSEKARDFFAAMFGTGAVSVNLRRSFAGDFVTFAKQKGLDVE